MATNHYFNNYEFSGEQRLFQDLVVESIRIYGHNVWYVPRTLVNRDKIYEADDQSEYNSATFVEMYVKSVDGFSGDGTFMSKIAGLQIRDQVVFTIAKRTFDYELGPQGLERPREGDLVYFPLNQKLFKIMYVDNKPFFYQFGQLAMYDLTCELFEYSSEYIQTGVEEIDSLYIQHTLDVYPNALALDDGTYLTDELGAILTTEDGVLETADPSADNEKIQEEADEVLVYNEQDPFQYDGRL